MGDSGLEILHGGEGGDVELGARTSEHIFVFAFDPFSLTLSYICVVHYSLCHIIHTCVVPCIVSYCYIIYMLGLLVCASLVLNHKSFI